MRNQHSGRAETATGDVFTAAGAEQDETPQRAAERIWEETKHDPVETMKRFNEWARQEPARMLVILGQLWSRSVRNFLERNKQAKGAWKLGDSFRRTLARKERSAKNAAAYPARRQKITSDPAVRQLANDHSRTYFDRKRRGIKVVAAEISSVTGQIVNLIDKEVGPFKHIRIGTLELPQATTEQALAYCEKMPENMRFIRALCQMIPDPRRPIGEQWTAEIIQEARRAAANTTS